VRRMRAIYAERRLCLINAAERDLDPWMEISPGDGGMQMVAYLRNGLDDKMIAARANEANIHLSALSTYSLEPNSKSGLYLGFAAIPEPQIAKATRRFSDLLNSVPMSRKVRSRN